MDTFNEVKRRKLLTAINECPAVLFIAMVGMLQLEHFPEQYIEKAQALIPPLLGCAELDPQTLEWIEYSRAIIEAQQILLRLEH